MFLFRVIQIDKPRLTSDSVTHLAPWLMNLQGAVSSKFRWEGDMLHFPIRDSRMGFAILAVWWVNQLAVVQVPKVGLVGYGGQDSVRVE